MEKIISWLGQNSLRVNYFTFFIISVLFYVLAAFLPFGLNVAVAQVLKFLMIFSIAMFVADNMKVIRLSFWGLLVYNLANLLQGVFYGLFEFMTNATLNVVLGVALSLLYLSVLVLLLRHALPQMKSIVVCLLVIELYNICKPLLYNVLSSFSVSSVNADLFVVCWNIIPFLLLIPLFILIAKNGKEKWTAR